MSTALALPTTGDQNAWTPQEAALVEAAGLVTGPAANKRLAPRPIVEAFLAHCQRTGLDPIARQIYAIERGGKWGIQMSIDGARLVAQRSGEYEGQTPVQWTADGVTWVDVWLDDTNAPKAARVGVYRKSFREPVVAVATFKAYSAGGPMWTKMPALMLGKCAEALALRKAFPQDLSGLYTSEEMDQASPSSAPVAEPQASAEQPAPEVRQPSRDWLADANAAKSREQLRPVFQAAQEAGDLDVAIADGRSLKEYLWGLRESLPETVEDIVDAEVVEDAPVEQTTEWPVAEIPDGGES